MKLPKLPKPGDTISLIAPASPLPDQGKLPECIAAIESLGLKVKPHPTLEIRRDYLAGTPEERAKDIMTAFKDPDTTAILCLRGGFGTAHVLPLLDWDVIARSGKLFSGFSDLTALMTPMFSQSKLISLHAPTATFFAKEKEGVEASRNGLKRFLFEPWEGLSYRELCGDDFKAKVIVEGTARGRILGGNAAVFASLFGSQWIPTDEKFILFLEDIGEKPYRLDRYVTQILQSNLADRISGVALGQFTDCAPGSEDRDDADTVLTRLLKPLGVPVLAGLPIGHDYPSFPIPIGMEAVLDGKNGDLILGAGA
ncbi:MAG: LD-carboxypeptidase [Candidatus Sumerlaeia bacterium]|nr:LD-carboxypeptidase [Candidatus Sumerlaeia bacterium]